MNIARNVEWMRRYLQEMDKRIHWDILFEKAEDGWSNEELGSFVRKLFDSYRRSGGR